MSESKRLLLAMETGIAGGSLSIWDENGEIDFWIGKEEVSKAEDVLQGIEILLKKNRIKTAQIESLAVTSDVGSTTGLKIGLATAQGLAKASGSRVVELSLWKSLAAVMGQNS